MWWKVLKPYASRALEGAMGMAGGMALKRVLESEHASGLLGRLESDLGIRFNPLNLTDPFGTQAESDEAAQEAERNRAAKDLKASKAAADKQLKAAQKSGNVQAQQAAQTARLEAELAFRDKLAALERANEVKYRAALRRGDVEAQKAAVANQQRNDVAKRLAQSEAELKLVTAQKQSEGSDIGKLKAMFDLMASVKSMTLIGADVPKFNAAQVNADLDLALSQRDSEVNSFLRLESATPESSDMSGPFYPVTMVTVREG